MKYAIINQSNIVTNLIEWDGSSTYSPSNGSTIRQAGDVHIGATYNPQNGSFANPIISPAEKILATEVALDRLLIILTHKGVLTQGEKDGIGSVVEDNTDLPSSVNVT